MGHKGKSHNEKEGISHWHEQPKQWGRSWDTALFGTGRGTAHTCLKKALGEGEKVGRWQGKKRLNASKRGG